MPLWNCKLKQTLSFLSCFLSGYYITAEIKQSNINFRIKAPRSPAWRNPPNTSVSQILWLYTVHLFLFCMIPYIHCSERYIFNKNELVQAKGLSITYSLRRGIKTPKKWAKFPSISLNNHIKQEEPGFCVLKLRSCIYKLLRCHKAPLLTDLTVNHWRGWFYFGTASETLWRADPPSLQKVCGWIAEQTFCFLMQNALQRHK